MIAAAAAAAAVIAKDSLGSAGQPPKALPQSCASWWSAGVVYGLCYEWDW